MGLPGGSHQGDPAVGDGKGRQGGQEQGQFADAGALAEQFGQAAPGPAATGQFGIELGMAAGNTGLRQAGQGVAAPHVAPGQHLGKPRRQRGGGHGENPGAEAR